MTIDEAIAHERAVVRTNKFRLNNCPLTMKERYEREECAKEHEQIAELLEELKQYQAIGTVKELENIVCGMTEQELYREGYNKAIDDFSEKIKENISESLIWGMIVNSHKDNSFNDTSDKIVDYVIDTVKETAEQLKGGGVNE